MSFIKLKLWALSLNLVLIGSSLASTPLPISLKKEMHEIAKSVESILPLAFSENKLSSKNLKQIDDNLKYLGQQLDSARAHMGKDDLRSKLIGKLTIEFLNEARQAFSSGHTDYAKAMVKSIPKFCISCHSQDHKTSSLPWKLAPTAFDSLYAYGEYKQMIRQYDDASEAFLNYLTRPGNDYDFYKQKAIMQLLQIHVKINDVPKEAYKFFLKLNSNQLHPMLKNDVIDIISVLKLYKDQKTFLNLNLSDANLASKIEQFINSISQSDGFLLTANEKVYYSILASNLHTYVLSENSHKEMPVALYWLAQSEKKLSYDPFYSIQDLYLKECMLSYPQHPYAKRCYATYREDVILSFTGSRGTEIPKDVLKELEDLRQMIFLPKPKK